MKLRINQSSLAGALAVICAGMGCSVPGMASAAAVSVYLAQSAQGNGDGSSCANARAASWFNSSSNWGSAATAIGPGTTVRLCGSVTTSLTFQGSGASGNPVTIDGAGATYTGTISTGSSRSWWTVQNVTWSANYGGTLLTVWGGSNGVFTGNRSDGHSGGNAIFLAQYNGSSLPDTILISNNYIRTTAADLGNTQHDIIITEGSRNVILEGNYLEMRVGGSGSNAHNDCIQTWEKGGTSGGGPANWTVRHNKIVMNSSASNDRSWMMLESLSGTNNIHGNVFVGIQGAGAANGISASGNRTGVIFNIFDNTFVTKRGASNNILNLASPGTANVRNNIFHTDGQTALTGSMSVVRDHNLWFGPNIPSCSGKVGEICGRDPLFTNMAVEDYSLKSTSPAIGVASNLGANYAAYVKAGAIWPSPSMGTRSATGNWSMGAYGDVSGNGGALAAPTNLKVN